MNEELIVFAIGFSACAIASLAVCCWYLRELIDIERDYNRENHRHWAESLDRYGTELEILKKSAGVTVLWDQAEDGKVPYMAPAQRKIPTDRMQA